VGAIGVTSVRRCKKLPPYLTKSVPVVINGLAGLVKCKTKDKLGLRRLLTKVSRAQELTKEVINWCLSYETTVKGDSPSL